MMPLKYLHNHRDYRAAMQQIDELWQSVPGTDEYNLYEILVELLDAYERDHWSMRHAHPIEAIQLHMGFLEYGVEDLAKMLGSLALAQDLLDKQTPLTVPMIWKIHLQWQIPSDSLIRPYELASEP